MQESIRNILKRRPHQSLNYQTSDEVEKAYRKNTAKFGIPLSYALLNAMQTDI